MFLITIAVFSDRIENLLFYNLEYLSLGERHYEQIESGASGFPEYNVDLDSMLRWFPAIKNLPNKQRFKPQRGGMIGSCSMRNYIVLTEVIENSENKVNYYVISSNEIYALGAYQNKINGFIVSRCGLIGSVLFHILDDGKIRQVFEIPLLNYIFVR